eukprot:gnl/TRDRNA2_/TRDRNA2_41266_c0_seq1.p1 gnl/TRDRNA2_/TRDRNA2_41266_c0~~gnl/TRDRNA2_/TRDRNA2_41266_c0_seq1.p1  ORF type:complete len:323 (+),score=40.58 gnl/TRDRNA2_/TRDRNA2_41266_c0_seq1:119-1087(+)
MPFRECFACGNEYSWDSGRFSKSQWAKGEQSRCKSCVSCSGSVGGATGDGAGGFETIRDNTTNRYAASAGDNSINAEVYQNKLFAQGAFKLVYRGLYTAGSRRGEECVFKKFKPRVAHCADYFDKDVQAAEKAAQLVEKWNSQRFTRLKIRVNVPDVLTTGRGQQQWLVEPFVHNWVKFNSNSGWYRDEDSVDEVMQALSHYSYHASGGQFLLCDLQGGKYRDGVILSDPIVLSRQAERYGGGDLGPWGISTFFGRHRCNDFCCPSWSKPRDQSIYIESNEGSSLLGNRGIPTTRHLHTLEALDECDESTGSDYYRSSSSSW